MNSTISTDSPYRICFVCLGNICRSPTAEGIFQHIVRQAGVDHYFYIDSAGTAAYHIGNPANSKSRQVALDNGVELLSRARQIDPRDLEEFDLIIAMDNENLKNIRHLDPAGLYHHKIKRMRDFDPEPEGGEVPDPYYGGMEGFRNVYKILYRSCENLFRKFEPRIQKEERDM